MKLDNIVPLSDFTPHKKGLKSDTTKVDTRTSSNDTDRR